MKLTPIIFCSLLLLLLPHSSFADTTEDITLTDGTEYKNVVVMRVEKDGIVVQTADGVQKLPMALVPKEVQLVHPYVPPSTPPPPSTATPVSTPRETPKPQLSTPASALDTTGKPAAGHGMGFMDDSCEPFIKGAVAIFVSLAAALIVAWFIASRLIASCARRQKQKEFDTANAQQFHTAYMDFFAIWKLWNHYLDHGENELPDHGEYEIPHASRWELLTRTYIAEGTLEAVFLKVTSARKLTPASIELLGRFRQAFHTLGQAITSNKPLNWKDAEHPDYLIFKRLASGAAAIIAGETLGAQATDLRSDAFRQITSGRWDKTWSSESSNQPAA